MKFHYQLNDDVRLEFEVNDLQEFIKTLTTVRTAIGIEPCGKCKGYNTIPNHREVTSDGETNEYYEIKCLNPTCGAVLQLGQNKEGKTLYKKKMKTNAKGKAVKEGDKAVYLPNNGWAKYNPETKQME